MTDTVRFAIIGYGNIGRRHAHHIMRTPGAELVAVCDIDPTKDDAVPEDTLFFTEVEDLLERGIADVACICTPNYLHEAHAVAALRAGMHAVVEKPMAISTDSCDRMIAAAAETG